MSFTQACVAVIGGGPAGLMAAEILSRRGAHVTVYDRMPSPGRKLLIAGRGGLNLTHSEALDVFLLRYGEAATWLKPILERFPPVALRAWADGLGAETFVGTSGRIFPKAMSAKPLLRAWLKRLQAQGVVFLPKQDWLGWSDDGQLLFNADGVARARADATILALGGASWPHLGSNGAWTETLTARGVEISPLRPANCGFCCSWSAPMRTFAGAPLKNAAFSFGGRTARGEAVITDYGLEGGAIYVLAHDLREAIAAGGQAELTIDLRPDMPVEAAAARLTAVKSGQSQSNALRKALHLSPAEICLLREGHGVRLPRSAEDLAAAVKALPVSLVATAPIARAISSAGGLLHREVDADLQLVRLPGVYAAGEMLDWEAPTGGYLLSACFATAVTAAQGAARRLDLPPAS